MAFDSDMRRFHITTGSVPTTNVRGVVLPAGECLYQEYIGASDKYTGVIQGKLADLTERFSVMENYALSYIDPDEPDLVSISPTTGSTAGGTSVTATTTGTNSSQCTVTVGGVAATNVRCNATSVTFTTPAGTAGAKAVVITTAEGTDTLAAAFTYS
ncbi:IPT/TIG domain-containing protein [Actinocorallia libanotica]|uniref:IPT/TIG domain-containing protein n=1 Tax=Actinocorallia libanotica TaxID=46162 RepID=A0ABN1Q0Y3_9ACTN